MVNSKNEKVRKAGIALLIVLVIAGSITIIAINREKKENSYSNGENKNTNREINEDMIFIPLGISNKDRNRYELTQYINDVTTQNTQVLMEYSNESGITAYSYGNERLSYEVNGETYRYNYDGRGSVTNLLDNNNASVVQYNYKPFGETTKSGIKSDELENTYQYNAESTDAITGLQYLRARYYDSETGRFISQDTYRGEITNPLSRNLYLYTNNDPVNYVDPSGHFWNEISNWGKSVVNGVKNAWNTTVQTVKNVGNAISNAVSNVVSTVKNAVSSVTNAVTNTVKNVGNYIKNTVTNISNNVKRVTQKVTNKATKIGNDIANKVNEFKGASYNYAVEKSKDLEESIKYWRQQGTAEAEQMIKYLQEEMKKTCESSLSRISNSNTLKSGPANALLEIEKKRLETDTTIINTVKNAMEQLGSFNFGQFMSLTYGTASDTVALGYGIKEAIVNGNGISGMISGLFDGIQEFNTEYSKPLEKQIKEFLGLKDEGYNIGYGSMEVAKMALSICTIVKSIPTLATKVGGVISKLGNISSWGASGASGAGGEAVLAGNLVKVEAFVKATSTTIAGVISTGAALLSVTSPFDSTVSHFTEETSGGGSSNRKREELLRNTENEKLKNTIKEMYRENANVGDGGLADAIRHELNTGELVGGKSHIIKGEERVRNLENILKNQNKS